MTYNPKPATLAIFLMSSFVFCNLERKPPLETLEIQDESGMKIIFTRRKTDLAKEGLCTKLTADGRKYEDAYYHNDTLEGERKIYYPDGAVKVMEHYKRGIFTGVYKSFYPSSALELEGQYINGAMNGIWKRFYESGELMEQVTFVDNEENGPFIEYHKNGKLKAEGNYASGNFEQGLLTLYDENGQLIRKMDCVHGRCKTIID